MLKFLIRRFSSFTYLNVTQFCGALNDNIFKLLTVFFLIQLEGIENSHTILSLTGATFVLPFLLFSTYSGTLADRFSKRDIIFYTKIFELVIMILAVVAFAFDSKFGAYCILFLLATQSAIFGPSKYGILPELVPSDKISQANGLMTSFTFLAIILGTFFASFALDISSKNFIVASLFCVTVSIAGLITSYCIEYTIPSGSRKKFNPILFHEIISALRLANRDKSLLVAILGAAYFLFLGAYMQLNMIPYAVECLGMTDVQGGYLFLLTAIGIGTGCLIAGKISGSNVELGLVPLACLGVTISLYLLDFFSGNLYVVLPSMVAVGMFGGMFQIPLDSYVQVSSPSKSRGQIVAATNFVSFIGVLLASGFIYFTAQSFGMTPAKGFRFVGGLTLAVTVTLCYQYFDYLTRLICMVLSKLHFSTSFRGTENIPQTPAVYVCTHTAWNDTLIMLGAQRRRLKFFIEQEQDHSKWLKRLYLMLRVYLIPGIQPLENNEECIQLIKETLKKGISVCIFVQNENICSEIAKLEKSYSFKKILDDLNYPMIPIVIEKGEKEKQHRFFKRFMEKIRVPAEVSIGQEICQY